MTAVLKLYVAVSHFRKRVIRARSLSQVDDLTAEAEDAALEVLLEGVVPAEGDETREPAAPHRQLPLLGGERLTGRGRECRRRPAATCPSGAAAVPGTFEPAPPHLYGTIVLTTFQIF